MITDYFIIPIIDMCLYRIILYRMENRYHIEENLSLRQIQ